MAQGVIARIFEKPWQNKKFYSLTLRGQDGIYGSGMQKPPAVGTSIKFNEKTNKAGYLEVDGTIEILADGETAPAGSVANVARQITGADQRCGELAEGNRKGYWDLKNGRDLVNDAARELGASRNTALTIIDLALKYEVITLPGTKAKREEFLFGVLDKYTKRLMGKGFVDESVHEAAEVAEPVSNDPQSDEWN